MRSNEYPLITIIVPVYNVEHYIQDCLESIIAQTYYNLEIILVDDGSTDKSGEVCDTYEKTDCRIKVFHKVNGGLSSARNFGLDNASGEYIAFVDSDDIISKYFIIKLYNLIKSEHAEIASCAIKSFEDGSGIYKSFMKSIDGVLSNVEYVSQILSHQLSNAVCNKLYSINAIGSFRFYEGIINEDFRFIIPLMEYVKKIAFTSAPLYYYRMRRGSITRKLHPRCFDYVNNGIWAKEFIPSHFDSINTNIIDSYLHQEMIGFMGLLAKYNFPIQFNKEICVCSEELRHNFFRILLDINIDFKQKIKLLLIETFPQIL